VLTVREFATSYLTRKYTAAADGRLLDCALIACADVANVQFARVSGRQKDWQCARRWEQSRARIVKPTSYREYSPGAAGSTGGLLIAQWDLVLILANMPAEWQVFAGWKTISLDSMVSVLRWRLRYSAEYFPGLRRHC